MAPNNFYYGHAATSGTVGYATGYFPYSGGSAANTSYLPGPRHNGGSNFIFADGHTKWVKPDNVSPGLAAPSASSAASQAAGCYNAVGINAMGQNGDNSFATFSPV